MGVCDSRSILDWRFRWNGDIPHLDVHLLKFGFLLTSSNPSYNPLSEQCKTHKRNSRNSFGKNRCLVERERGYTSIFATPLTFKTWRVSLVLSQSFVS
jgi:hypothetical protein